MKYLHTRYLLLLLCLLLKETFQAIIFEWVQVVLTLTCSCVTFIKLFYFILNFLLAISVLEVNLSVTIFYALCMLYGKLVDCWPVGGVSTSSTSSTSRWSTSNTISCYSYSRYHTSTIATTHGKHSNTALWKPDQSIPPSRCPPAGLQELWDSTLKILRN